jgi:hypothetical protein
VSFNLKDVTANGAALAAGTSVKVKIWYYGMDWLPFVNVGTGQTYSEYRIDPCGVKIIDLDISRVQPQAPTDYVVPGYRKPQDQNRNSVPTVWSAIADQTIVNQSGTQTVALTNVFTDADGDTLTLSAKSSATGVATVSVAADPPSLTLTAKKRGTATIMVTADDGYGGLVSDSLTVTVKAAPTVAAAIADIGELKAGASRQVSLSGVFADADGDTLTFGAASSSNAVARVSAAIDGSSLTVSGVGAGTATITVTARDTDGNQATDTFDVTVPAAQQQKQQQTGPPVAGQLEPYDVQVTPGDGTLTVTWSVAPRSGVSNDEIRHALRWSQVSGVWANPRDPRSGGREDGIVVEGGVASYTIKGLTNDVATGVFVRSFTGGSYSEKSGQSSEWVRTKGVHTTPVAGQQQQQQQQQATPNSPPTVASAIDDVSALEIGATHEVSLSGVFSDADGDSLSVTIKSSDNTVAVVSTALDGTTGAVTGVTVVGKGAGTATVTVTARDTDGNSVSDAFAVTVSAPPPPQEQQQQQQTQQEETGPPVEGQLEPYNVQVTPGDGTLTVTWSVAPRAGVSIDSIKHALRWSQVSGVWANPRESGAGGREDGIVVNGGVATYTITGLANGVATGVFVRSFTGGSYSERSKHSSEWVRIKGEQTTPRADE